MVILWLPPLCLYTFLGSSEANLLRSQLSCIAMFLICIESDCGGVERGFKWNLDHFWTNICDNKPWIAPNNILYTPVISGCGQGDADKLWIKKYGKYISCQKKFVFTNKVCRQWAMDFKGQYSPLGPFCFLWSVHPDRLKEYKPYRNGH